MLTDRQTLVEEIERLEKELDAQHFRVLFDRKPEQKKLKHLKKLRKELAELDGTAVSSQPVRRAEPKPEPKPKAPPKPVLQAKAAAVKGGAAEPKRPMPSSTPPARKPAAPAKPARKPVAAAKKPTAKPPASRKKPAPVSKSRKSK